MRYMSTQACRENPCFVKDMRRRAAGWWSDYIQSDYRFISFYCCSSQLALLTLTDCPAPVCNDGARTPERDHCWIASCDPQLPPGPAGGRLGEGTAICAYQGREGAHELHPGRAGARNWLLQPGTS